MKQDPNTNHGEFTAPGEVRFVRHLPGSIERVWAFLTESDKRGKWLAPGKMELRVGGSVELNFFHADLTPEPIPKKYEAMKNGHTLRGRVTRCDPPRLLSYTWGDEPGDDSEVTFELSALPEGGVQLVLTHRRLGDQPGLVASVGAGWHSHLAILIAHLAGGPPVMFWSMHSRYEPEYAARLKG